MRLAPALTLLVLIATPAVTQQPAPPPASGSSIPPNYGYYNLNGGYTGEPVLGWSERRIEEDLGRGLLAIRKDERQVYVGWRLLKDDPEDIAFNVYRSTTGNTPVRINSEPIRATTDFIDTDADLTQPNDWFVRPVLGGEERGESGRTSLPANPPQRPYITVPLRDDVDTRSIHKLGIGDLDGDGEYDFVVKRPGGVTDPGRVRRSEDTFKVEGYRSDGTFLWRNDLGWSIELGTWYSPMVVYDFNGDGRAEVAIKTGEGDPRDENGRVFTGPEYVSVWDGTTGRQIARAPWIDRGQPSDWGGNGLEMEG